MPDAGKRWVDYIPLDELAPAERNPKGHDGHTIRRMISHHGLGELPLLDERTGRLVAGHGRREQLLEMRAAGKSAPSGVDVDPERGWLVPVIRGWSSSSDDDAEAYVIGSNQSAINGGWADERQLAEMLGDLGEAQMLELAGWNADGLDQLLRRTDALGDAAAALINRPQQPAGEHTPALASGQNPDEAADVEPSGAGHGYVIVQWSVLPENREIIRAAIRRAQQQWDIPTAADALVALARHFVDQPQGAPA